MMKDYELVLIVDPEIGEENSKKILESTEKLVASLEGKVKKTTIWGKQELAYPVKKRGFGVYFLLVLTLPASAPSEISKKLKLEAGLLRFLIVGSD
jgi:small subunit ribosomal protein S6